MKVSKRGEYALRALIDMGIAHELGRPLIQIGDLAEKERLPIKFLEQILMQLKEAQFIESKRGKLGGYQLSMPAKKIRIGQVIRLIDGPLAPISCVSVIAYERCTCPDEEHCGLRMLMNDVRTAIANILDKFTLEDTVQMTLRKIRRNKPSIPFVESLLRKPLSTRAKSAGRKKSPSGAAQETALKKKTGMKKTDDVSKTSKRKSPLGTSFDLVRPKAGANTLKAKNRKTKA